MSDVQTRSHSPGDQAVISSPGGQGTTEGQVAGEEALGMRLFNLMDQKFEEQLELIKSQKKEARKNKHTFKYKGNEFQQTTSRKWKRWLRMAQKVDRLR